MVYKIYKIKKRAGIENMELRASKFVASFNDEEEESSNWVTDIKEYLESAGYQAIIEKVEGE